jgi:hypothetical protein
MNAVSDILPSGLKLVVDLLIGAVRIGVRRFGRGGAGANAPAGEATMLLGRLVRILRFAFVILAVHLTLPALRAQARPSRAAPRPSVRRASFPLFPPPFRIDDVDRPRAPMPAALARATRDRMLTTQRKLDVLTRALADPMRLVRRMARRLPTQLMVIGWRPPKRPPPGRRREFWEELVEGWREARFQLGEWRRRRRVIAAGASGS